VSFLRATYQVRLLIALAMERGQTLRIVIPRQAEVHPELRRLVRSLPSVVKIERYEPQEEK